MEELRQGFLEAVPEGAARAPVPVRVDAATLEALRALGYVDDPPDSSPAGDRP